MQNEVLFTFCFSLFILHLLIGCGLDADPGIPSAGVIVVGVEQLTPPDVPQAHVYRPGFIFDIPGPAGPPDAQAWGFFLDLAGIHPDRLQVRLRDHRTGVVSELVRVPTPANLNTLEAHRYWQLESPAPELLAGGSGVFWNVPPSSGGSVHRLAVAVPDQLPGPISYLEVYADTVGGHPVGAARIELVREFFYLAVIGDSVAWGNGLRDWDKYSTLVMRAIEDRTSRRVIRQVHALSGARILPAPDDVVCPVSCSGEVPTASTSITTQVDLLQRPDLIDLVLLSGCINDVGVDSLLDPEVPPDVIAEQTSLFCGQQMLDLLGKLRAATPQAMIVVTGYFPIISEESALPELIQFLVASGEQPEEQLDAEPEDSSLIKRFNENARLFERTSRESLMAAVEDVNSADGTTSVAYVDAGFGPENALFAHDSWLWGLSAAPTPLLALEGQPILLPEDTLADLRARACFSNQILVPPMQCLYASVGHPNIAGARAYAAAILAALEAAGVLSP